MIVNRLLARQIKHLIRYNLHSPARRRDKSHCTGIKLHGRTSPCLSSHSELDLLCSQACCFTDLPMSGGAERKQNDPEMFFDGASEHGDFFYSAGAKRAKSERGCGELETEKEKPDGKSSGPKIHLPAFECYSADIKALIPTDLKNRHVHEGVHMRTHTHTVNAPCSTRRHYYYTHTTFSSQAPKGHNTNTNTHIPEFFYTHTHTGQNGPKGTHGEPHTQNRTPSMNQRMSL